MADNLKKIILYGGNGFVGLNLQQSLIKNNYEVTVISPNDNPKRKPIIKYISNKNGINPEIEESIKSCDSFIHLYSSSTPAEFDYKLFSEVELKETLTILEIINSTGKKTSFIYLSTGGAIYGLNHINKPFNESTLPQPISDYGFSKLTMENYINWYGQRGAISPVILRPSNLYGYGNIKPNRNIVNTCFLKLIKKETLEIWGNGNANKDYLFMDDFCDLVELIIKNPISGTYNIGSDMLYSVNEIVNTIEKITNIKINVIKTNSTKVDVTSFSLDLKKTQNTYHWKAKVSLEEGLKIIWRQLKSNNL